MEHPQKQKQRDPCANWAKRGNDVHFGCKDNIKMGLGGKIIAGFQITTAATNVVKGAGGLFSNDDNVVYGEAAYTGLNLILGVDNRICEKGVRTRPFTDRQREDIHQKAKPNCRVEFVFADMAQMVGGCGIKCKNISRAISSITFNNLMHSMRRVISFLGSVWPNGVLLGDKETKRAFLGITKMVKALNQRCSNFIMEWLGPPNQKCNGYKRG